MNIVNRDTEKLIYKYLKPGKVVVLYGPRRVGKTLLIQKLLKNASKTLILNGEDIGTHNLLSTVSLAKYKNLVNGHDLIFIDEAQKIADIGLKLKFMVDNFPKLKIIITGSSAIDISNKSGEPLTGRNITFNLYPLSENEVQGLYHPLEKNEKLRERLIYGSYPELLHIESREDKAKYLRDLVSSYLLKDILIYENLKSSDKIFNLLRLLAFQIGGEVSVQELGKQLGISKNTVDKYLDLLSKVFILFNLKGYSRNLRKEISKNSRWYFLDNGIRNAIISNFNDIENRNDIGQLWENYIIGERIKYQEYNQLHSNNFFWRTYDRQEIDFVEERDGNLFGFEIKWGDKIPKVPNKWVKNYPDAKYNVINQDNYLEWLIPN